MSSDRDHQNNALPPEEQLRRIREIVEAHPCASTIRAVEKYARYYEHAGDVMRSYRELLQEAHALPELKVDFKPAQETIDVFKAETRKLQAERDRLEVGLTPEDRRDLLKRVHDDRKLLEDEVMQYREIAAFVFCNYSVIAGGKFFDGDRRDIVANMARSMDRTEREIQSLFRGLVASGAAVKTVEGYGRALKTGGVNWRVA